MRTTASADVMAISEQNQAEEPRLVCIIKDLTSPYARSKHVSLPKSYTVHHLIEHITKEFHYKPGSYKLLYETHGAQTYELNDKACRLCDYMAPDDLKSKKAKFQITELEDGVLPVSIVMTEKNQSGGGSVKFDELSILDKDNNTNTVTDGRSFTESMNYNNDKYITAPSSSSAASALPPSYDSIFQTAETGYCGLVNQAMTCYLNSLLQTLYMTPEFRNAIYSWEFDAASSKSREEKCIPYQLQKLFLRMQTGKHKSVETTAVTTSFGWDSSYSWQQHDVQELCRVMFDALEITWKDTSQADLINQLYQGKLKDYVKCLTCKMESARTDAYLDIPLVIKPFGAATSHSSVEEALRAFIEPEILSGNNQYQCDNCQAKCDAHKGLKFVNFPYLLTLQLKRFDFDYCTMHRIKLNDRMSFPAVLDLNSLVDDTLPPTPGLDPGTQFDEFSDSGFSRQFSFDDGEYDLTDKEVVKALIDEKGEYVYELFSIMIHSGSAIGGHYYAYIKCLSDGQWYCFNDQSVTRITREDIKKVYGGSGTRGLYSSSYASSTNAYMLMYRKIDPDRNSDFMKENDFPPHLQNLIQNMNSESEAIRKAKEIEKNTCKIRTCCTLPNTKKPTAVTLEVHKDLSLAEATDSAYKLFELEGTVPRDCVRLVKYDEYSEVIDRSYDSNDTRGIGEILGGIKATYMFELFLEIKQPGDEWLEYKPGGITLKAYRVDLSKGIVTEPISIRANQDNTIKDLKLLACRVLKVSHTQHTRCAIEKYSQALYLLTNDDQLVRNESLYKGNKIYVEAGLPPFSDNKLELEHSRFKALVDRYQNTIRLQITLPAQDEIQRFKQKEEARIKSDDASCSQSDEETDDLYDSRQKSRMTTSARRSAVSQLDPVLGDTADTTPLIDNSPPAYDEIDKIPCAECQEYSGCQCKSGPHTSDAEPDAGDDDMPLGACAGGDADDFDPRGYNTEQTTAVEAEETGATTTTADDGGSSDCDLALHLGEGGSGEPQATQQQKQYTRQEGEEEDMPKGFNEDGFLTEELEKAEDGRRDVLSVQLDRRTNVGNVKKLLSQRLDLPANLFKMYRVFSNNQEVECSNTDTLTTVSDNTRMTVKLSRVLGKGEYSIKVYELVLNASSPSEASRHLFDMIVCKGMTIEQLKALVSEELQIELDRKLSVDQIRLRKKSWKTPGQVYIDSQKLEVDILVYNHWEIFIQVLEEPERVRNQNDICLFVQQWHPSKYELGKMFEVVIPSSATNPQEALRSRISRKSDIPLESLEITKSRGEFPISISVLEIHTGLDWIKPSSEKTLNSMYLDSGYVILYRDKNEQLGSLTAEQRKEISVRENSLYGKTNYSTYSRKEQSLKIFMDDHHTSSNDTPTVNNSSDSTSLSCSNLTSGPAYKPDELD